MNQDKKKQEEKETLEQECEKAEQSIEYPEPRVSLRPLGAIASSVQKYLERHQRKKK